MDNHWTDPIYPRLLFSLSSSLSPYCTHSHSLTLLLSLSSSKMELGHRDTCSPSLLFFPVYPVNCFFSFLFAEVLYLWRKNELAERLETWDEDSWKIEEHRRRRNSLLKYIRGHDSLKSAVEKCGLDHCSHMNSRALYANNTFIKKVHSQKNAKLKCSTTDQQQFGVMFVLCRNET